MKLTLTVNGFMDAFNQVRPNAFSYAALGAIFDYYEELDPTMEFDPDAICCGWSEGESGAEAHRDAEESGAYIIELENGNVLIQE